MTFLLFLIALIASTIGAISGIGGGIIIKPVLDGFTSLSPACISFMSGCTVLSMAISSYIRGLKSTVQLDYKISLWLATGAALGGYFGKTLFSLVPFNVTLLQSILLLIINLAVYFYMRYKNKIHTLQVTKPLFCFVIGALLGLISAFLGIGGGPINIMVLSYFFSMSTKICAKNSLFIILFSQFTSFFTTLATHTVPSFEPLALIFMCLGGVGGALLGSAIVKKISDTAAEKFFVWVLMGLLLLNIYNCFMGFFMYI